MDRIICVAKLLSDNIGIFTGEKRISDKNYCERRNKNIRQNVFKWIEKRQRRVYFIAIQNI